jgi:hypothetical protein
VLEGCGGVEEERVDFEEGGDVVCRDKWSLVGCEIREGP